MIINPPIKIPGPHTSQHLLFSEEWAEFFGSSVNLESLEKLCIEGRLRGSRIRSVVWRVLLKSLPFDRREWDSILTRNRNRYDRLKQQMVVDPRNTELCSLDIELSNPLSQRQESPWQQYFDDCELRDCIDKDVKRTFSEVQFFRDEDTRRLLSDILFVYAKCHPHISYKQGMHEILAPLLFVIYLDLQSFGHLVEQNGLSELQPSDIMRLQLVFDSSFLENDAFDIFSQLMMLLEGWYLAADEVAPKPTLVPASVDGIVQSFCRDGDIVPNSELLRKLQSIGSKILAQVDPPLYNHLDRLEIHPQLYGIRWLRLLFGREFPIHDVFYVWDAIFACRPLLSLVDYMFVAFLEQIRHLLLGSDYTTCLQYLMRYPPIVDVHAFIQLALHIKSPKKYMKPRHLGVTDNVDTTEVGASHSNKDKFEAIRHVSPSSLSHSVESGYLDSTQNRKLHDSFVGKFVDSIFERSNSGGSVANSMFKSLGHPMNEIILLKEQVSNLQSRLNTVNLVAKVAAKRIEGCIEDILLVEGNRVLRQRLVAELRNISDQLVRSTVPEEWVRNVGIPDASVERSGVELAREADNLRSPLMRERTRNTRTSLHSDRELVDMKRCSKRQTLFR